MRLSLRRGKGPAADRLPSDRQPRLALRFAVVTALGFALAGALILAVVRGIDQRHAVRAATERTHFVAETFLRGVIQPSDSVGPVSADRRRELDRLMRRYVLIDGALRVSLVGTNDMITYSTDHRLIGSAARNVSDLDSVRKGVILSHVAGVPAVDRSGTVKALVSSVPIALSSKNVVVVSVEQDYAPIAQDARESLLPVAAVLELALILLFVLLLPVLGRASRSLRAYVAEIRHQARHDALTGLSNRVALHDNVAVAVRRRREGEHIAVLLIDLDRFKEVNDSLGHDAGDELLCELARRLVEAAGDAPVSRLGGDEFAVVLERTTPQQAMEIGVALRLSIEAPCSIRGIPVSVDASVGLALGPDDGTLVGQLVRRADVAMYAAKQTRAGVLRYDIATDRNDASKLVLMTELRAAVEGGELEVHYQPIIKTRCGTLAKVEALVRWQHPTKGMIPPEAFIPLAEHTRLVVALNRFVLQESVRQCGIWRSHGVDLGVTVNMTVLDLLESSFASDVAEILRAATFPPSALTIEITEGAFVREPDRVRSTLDALRALGVQVAIDDFGTGYSSLSYLKDLPVDLLKIDRSFVADLPESVATVAIVAATIDLSHRLGLTVVAEGVETDEQYECLEELGCDLIQGYAVSKPLPADMFGKMMEEASGSEAAAA